MATLAQGQAVKLHCAISQEITVTPSTGGRATISANGPGNVSYAQKTISAAETFGPYLSDTDVVIAAVAGSLSYDLGTASMVDVGGNVKIPMFRKRANGTTLMDFTGTMTYVAGGGGTGGSSVLQSGGLLFGNSVALNTGTGNAGAFAHATTTGLSFTLQDDDVLLLVADVGITANNGFVRVAVSSTGFGSSQIYHDHFFKTEHGSRVYIPFRMSDGTATGGELTTNTFNSIRVYIQANVTTGATAVMHGVLLNQQSRPRLLIDFDDGWVSQYTQAFRYMTKMGIRGNIAVIYNRIGTAGYLTLAQLRELYESGWDLTSHGDNNHSAMASRAAVLADIIANRDYLINNGFTRAPLHYVAPGGVYSTANDTLGALAEAGMVSCRNVVGNPLPTTNLGIDSKYGLWSQTISQTTSVATLLSKLDLAIDCGATQRMHGHRIVPTVADANNELSIADFKTLIDGVAARVYAGKLDVVTMSEWSNDVGLT
jgi:peptidoglycan/xylan/chitin deacetylase (PgdA/CDA1 family)